MNKFSDAKVMGFWANPKGLTDYLIRLLRLGGRFATKGQKGLCFCRKGNAWDDKLHSRIKIKAFLFCILLTYTYLCTQQEC